MQTEIDKDIIVMLKQRLQKEGTRVYMNEKGSNYARVSLTVLMLMMVRLSPPHRDLQRCGVPHDTRFVLDFIDELRIWIHPVVVRRYDLPHAHKRIVWSEVSQAV